MKSALPSGLIALLLLMGLGVASQMRAYQVESVGSEPLAPTYFNLNSSEIRRHQIARIGQIVDTLGRNADRSLILSGHTDDRENPALARSRVDSVRRFLVDAGIAESRIMIDEDAAPKLCAVPTEFCWQRDRRVDFAVR